MLRITTHVDQDAVTLKLEGRLAGPWVKELEQCWCGCGRQQANPVRIDLSGVTHIDGEGKALLARLYAGGAQFLTRGCLTTCIVEEIKAAAGGGRG
ncbi:STAS domain-containing protein [Candidatus Nitrospira bockiana]